MKLLTLQVRLLPFAAVVTPGSLFVQATAQVGSMTLRVPHHYYNYSEYAVVESYGAGLYRSPTTEVGRIAIAAATSGQVLTISSAYQNESYVLEFFAPAIRCTPDDKVQKAMLKAGTIGDNHSGATVIFASWIEGDISHGSPKYYLEGPGNWQTIGAGADDSDDLSLQLYVAATPGLRYDTDTPEVYQCVCHNASYVASFNFQYTSQNVTIKSVDLLEPLSALLFTNTLEASKEQQSGILGINGQRLSYAAILDAFDSILVGAAEWSHYGAIYTYGGTRYAQTKIDWTSTNSTISPLEELFQNITLSMLSSSKLTQNERTATPTSTTVLTYPNKYVYEPRVLWLSYGITIGTTTICVGFGFEAIFRNRTAFSNRFSTILRTTRNAEFDRLVDETDDGADPVPKRIARAMLSHETHMVGTQGAGMTG